jgi:membrane-associated phospholipid phosphatase
MNALRSAPPALDPSLRRITLALAALSVIVVAVLGARYANEDAMSHLDRRLDNALDHIPAGRGGLAMVVISFGGPATIAFLTAVLTVVCVAAGRRRLALVAIVGTLLTGAATTLIKPIVGRTFVNGGLAFPSGHTGGTTAVALVTMLLLVSLLRLRPPWNAVAVIGGTLAAGVTMAVSLTVGFFHYATDTIGGFCTAVAVVTAVAWLVDLFAERAVHPQ